MTIVMKPQASAAIWFPVCCSCACRESMMSQPRDLLCSNIPKVLAARLHMQLNHRQASSAP